jgi:uncharacterized protein (DUF924 family)
MATIIVLDQFTRNVSLSLTIRFTFFRCSSLSFEAIHVHRGTRNAWMGDAMALRICLDGIQNGTYNKLPYIMRAQYP